MKKFVLQAPPETFKREVLIPMHDGSEASLIVEFKYRTRTEYAQFIDDIIAGAKKASESPEKAEGDTSVDKEITMQSIFNQQDDVAIDAMMKIASGWDLADKFNKTTLREMQNKYPGAFGAINEAYRASIVEGRLKN
jgi:hypothetical protein